jgi:hypothetical protein
MSIIFANSPSELIQVKINYYAFIIDVHITMSINLATTKTFTIHIFHCTILEVKKTNMLIYTKNDFQKLSINIFKDSCTYLEIKTS